VLVLGAWLPLSCSVTRNPEMIFLSTGVTKGAAGLFKEIGILYIFKAIYVYTGQSPTRGRGNGRRHCAGRKAQVAPC